MTEFRIVAVGDSRAFRAHSAIPLMSYLAARWQKLRAVDVIIMAPERIRAFGITRILLYRLLGLIKPKLIIFGSYKGIHLHPAGRRPHPLAGMVDAWVVHSRLDSQKKKGDRTYFLPLPTRISPSERSTSFLSLIL